MTLQDLTGRIKAAPATISLDCVVCGMSLTWTDEDDSLSGHGEAHIPCACGTIYMASAVDLLQDQAEIGAFK